MENFFKKPASKYILHLVGIIALIFSSYSVKANEEPVEKEESFNAGEMIFEHVLDAHDWHIMTIGGHHISIPLPIIIYDKEEGGLHMFSSAKFAHGHSHDGYMIPAEGEFKGKIIKESTGKPDGLIDFSITKTVFAIMFSAVLMLLIFISIANSYKKRKDQAPKGLQSAMEPLILFIRDDVAKNSIGKDYMRFMPYLLTIFFFIFINNIMGLIPIFP